MRSDRERLLDILEAIERIERYAGQGRANLEADELRQVWVLHHLQIIGEAVSRLSDPFRKQHSEAPWQEIIGMRNILVHHYFAVDTGVIWAAVAKDLPDLKAKIQAILKELD